MARQKEIRLKNSIWLLLKIHPDWDKIKELAKKVDDGDLSVLDKLIDLIVYEKETVSMRQYIELGAMLGNDKARYVIGQGLNDWNFKKLLLFRELADKGILGAKYDYEQTRSGFVIFYGGLAVILLMGIVTAYVLYQLIEML